MTQEALPTRSTERKYRCRCVMRNLREEPGTGRCPNEVNPDQPFCHQCENRHTDSQLVHDGYIIVTAYTGPN